MAKVNGLNEVKRSLRDLNEKSKDGVVRALEASVLEMADEADNHVPVDLGKLRQSIVPSVNKSELTGKLTANAPYAPDVEFGTMTYVSVPPELADVAAQFKGGQGGSFEDLYENIKGWCKRKGIDPKAAYPIAVSISKKGIKPQPYMYPAFLKGKSAFMSLISNLVKSLNK